ncbi:sel1 repeat family protein [Labrys sp. KNU-23]|nr:sel1 repeat family protein [Labrys sp. KNU-23]
MATAHAADSVTVPGYAPKTGVEYVYRSHKTTSTDMSLWFNKPAAIMRGDFRQSMTVLSRNTANIRVRWSLSADLPQRAEGIADSYAMNALYRNSLSAYGVHQLEYEAGLNGFPSKLIGFDAILRNIQSAAVVGPGGFVSAPESNLTDIIESIKSNPILVIHNLAPEAELLSTIQEQDSAAYNVGQTGTASTVEYSRSVPVPVTIGWKLEAADLAKQTATFSLKKTYDSIALQRSQASTVEGVIASFGEKAKQLTGEQLAAARIVSKDVTMTFIVSLRDGSTLEATETVAAQSGGMKITMMSHVWREDIPASLPELSNWNSQDVSASVVAPLPERGTNPTAITSQLAARSTLEEGQAAYDSGNYAGALRYWKPLADQGTAAAQYKLAGLYQSGLGVDRDPALAATYIRKAADQGWAEAQSSLSDLYAVGQDVPQDHAQAVIWGRKAAEQGLAVAQYNLGYSYESGQGVPRDYAQALIWYRRAADQGFATAQYALGLLYDQGLGVSQDYGQAVDWYKKAADQGLHVAQGNLGNMYAMGHGVARDRAEAIKWFRKAADQGLATAQESLKRLERQE